VYCLSPVEVFMQKALANQASHQTTSALTLFTALLIFLTLVILSALLLANPWNAPDRSQALRVVYAAQGNALAACSSVNDVRLYETAIPITSQPPTATPENAPTPTQAPPTSTPRPAPTEDRVGFPEGYQDSFKLLFVFDRPDNKQVRVICGNDLAAARQPDEPFPYGSIMVMETYRAKLDPNGQPVLDENGHFIRQTLTGLFVQRKEEGFGEAYEEERSGEWEYVAYRPDGSTFIPPENTANCASCHLHQAGEGEDFAFRMAMFHEGMEAMTAPEAAENEVVLFIYQFMPMNLTVKAGTTVTWVNQDEAEHTIVADSGLFESEVLMTANVAPGASFSFTFTEPGTYDYICSIHPAMKGTITVEA
jgi:plastocyanin